MTQQEALKLALEALETSLYPQQKQLQAITAIKEALAQPEPEPSELDIWKSRALQAEAVVEKFMAQPEQEPEAWYDKHGMVTHHPFEGVTPLYTTPPQRKPLTDEEIILIVADCASSHQHTDIHFARAIEVAHGIKEKNT